jgi:hypothetical protein
VQTARTCTYILLYSKGTQQQQRRNTAAPASQQTQQQEKEEEDHQQKQQQQQQQHDEQDQQQNNYGDSGDYDSDGDSGYDSIEDDSSRYLYIRFLLRTTFFF